MAETEAGPTYSWAVVTYAGESVGMVWTDNVSGIGYKPNAPSAAATEGVTRLTHLMAAARQLELEPSLAFAAVLHSLSSEEGFAYTQSEGSQVDPQEEDLSGYDAADPLESPFTLITNEVGTVLGLNQDTAEEASVREDGQWVPVTGPDDTRYFEGIVTYVTEEAVALYDKLVQDKTPTLDDFQEVRFE